MHTNELRKSTHYAKVFRGYELILVLFQGLCLTKANSDLKLAMVLIYIFFVHIPRVWSESTFSSQISFSCESLSTDPW